MIQFSAGVAELPRCADEIAVGDLYRCNLG